MIDEPTSEADAKDEDDTEFAAEAEHLDGQQRLWLRTITMLLQARAAAPDGSDRVQKALDRLYMAAADRAARILRSDIID